MSGNVGISFDDGSKVASTSTPLPVRFMSLLRSLEGPRLPPHEHCASSRPARKMESTVVRHCSKHSQEKPSCWDQLHHTPMR